VTLISFVWVIPVSCDLRVSCMVLCCFLFGVWLLVNSASRLESCRIKKVVDILEGLAKVINDIFDQSQFFCC